MKVRRYEIVRCKDKEDCLSLDDLACCAGLHPSIIEMFLEYDLIRPIPAEPPSTRMFEASAVLRLRRIERLRRDLGINLAGVSVILDMLDRIEALQRENELLRHSGQER